MDSDSSLYDKLITQCKTNDVDVKVDALTKLQACFENGLSEIPDPEALVGILKACLRASNFHLTNATLSALPAILPVLISRPVNLHSSTNVAQPSSSSTSSVTPSGFIDSTALRLALGSFLQTGGIIDRLGDREKAQVKARESLVLLGGYAFRFGGGSTLSKSGKGGEPPLAIFERSLKESGLMSKVWKIREQSTLTLVQIRRAHHLFPIRPYLSVLVDCLEDTDPHVRDCARQSVVELFSGPGVTDAARADLKKELIKKGVRKTIVDAVLSKLLNASTTGYPVPLQETSANSDNVSGKKEYIPPSLALQGVKSRTPNQGLNNSTSRTVSQGNVREIPRPLSRANMVSPSPSTPTSETGMEVQEVYIASSRDLENEFAAMQKPFEGKETEHNWAARDQAIQRVRGMLKGDVHTRYPEPFINCLKDGFIQWSLKTLSSLRTTVCVNTCLLYAELSVALGPSLDPLCDTLFSNLLKMASLTKKITAQQSQTTVTTIISNASPQPRLVIPLLWQTLQEKTIQARAYVVKHIKYYLEVHGHHSKAAIDAAGSTEILEKALKKALGDANPAVRESSRVLFWVFEDIWPDSGQVILNSLDSVARKQLEKASPKGNGNNISLPPTTPQVAKKSSVAAAIAASRAKAKAIATAPPTLRHKATSTSQMSSSTTRREGSPGASPKSSVIRPASPLRTQTLPHSSQRSVSVALPRTTSTTSVPGSSHIRTLSGSLKRERSASSSLSDSGIRRRLSSPLSNSISTPASRSPMPLVISSTRTNDQPSAKRLTPPSNKTSGNSASALPSRQPLFHVPGDEDHELLLAQNIPIPEDSNPDMDGGFKSFSASFETYPPLQTSVSQSKASSSLFNSDYWPPPSISYALSSASISDMVPGELPVVEDALRARAEQAESAAERLLELVEPDDDLSSNAAPVILSSLNGHTTPKVKASNATIRANPVPVTPNNRASLIMKQAALFIDSPAQGSQSTSLLDVLHSKKPETAWWSKRKHLTTNVSSNDKGKSLSSCAEELDDIIISLDRGNAGPSTLKRLAMICMENPVVESFSPSLSSGSNPASPSPSVLQSSTKALHVDIWENNKTFDRFFEALIDYLQPSRTEEELAYGLLVIWELLESQSPYLEGKESDMFSMLLRVRYSNKLDALEGTNLIRDFMTSKMDPVYGLTTMHASLKMFQSEPPPENSGEVKSATCAFSLVALGNFILRLPAEIAEEELPRLKTTLINSLNDKSSLIVRESAAACIIATQLVLRDETHLFTLLDGLADDKKNLLTYLFDKHGVRGNDAGSRTGIEKLEKEIRRLDTRTSTPLRGAL